MTLPAEQEYKALIDEDNCIGCGKCIRVCPTDAIVGGKHVLHTILPQLCTSCSNCINTCPTDCIELGTLGFIMSEDEERRLTEQKRHRVSQNRMVIPTIMFSSSARITPIQSDTKSERKRSIADAIARVKAKKSLIK